MDIYFCPFFKKILKYFFKKKTGYLYFYKVVSIMVTKVKNPIFQVF